MPIKVFDLELSAGFEPICGLEKYNGVYILVRYHGRPIQWVYLDHAHQPMIPAEQLHKSVTERLGKKLLPIVLKEQYNVGMANGVPLPPISVIVCTRDRADQLADCLQALLGLDYPNYEIIVVDNAPRSEETAKLVHRLPVRYVREDRSGLDWARNRGVVEACYDIVAFTDDDARPDANWLRAIAHTFAQPEVMAVTGFVAPTELETEAQTLFEFEYGGMGHGFKRQVFRRRPLTTGKLIWRNGMRDIDLLWASRFGVGANMAFRREIFNVIGPFDVALDVGTPSGGGGDVEMFHRVVARGYTLIYNPAMLVWHTHRRDIASLGRLVYDNGRSFGAYLLTCARNRTVSRHLILRFVVGQWLGGWLLRRLYRPGKFPRRLVALELAGALLSPLVYRAAQVHAKQVAVVSTAKDTMEPTPHLADYRNSL